MNARIEATTEKALRDAMYSVTQIEAGQIPPSLAALGDEERTQAVGLAITISAYVVVDACGAQWPTRKSVQRIAEDLATSSTNAKRLRLDPGQVNEYLTRVALGRERLEDLIPGDPEFTRLPVVIAGEALAGYAPKGMGKWDYLDRVEAGIEAASSLDEMVLPAAVMRAYMKPAEDR